MRRKRSIPAIIFICSIFIILSFISGGTSAQNSTVDNRLISEINGFGIELFRNLAEDSSKNVFISPISVATVMMMLADGAQGQTRDEIVNVLSLNEITENQIDNNFRKLTEELASEDTSIIFNAANSMWYRQGLDIKMPYLDISRSVFDSEIRATNFDSRGIDAINNWVSDKTNGKIESILDKPVNSDLVMILINAIYFYGSWKDPFDEDKTSDDFFTLADGSQIPCKMMNRSGGYRYSGDINTQIIEMPYKGGRYSMIIVLPQAGRPMDSFVKTINFDNFNDWIDGLSFRVGTIYLPRFKIEYSDELSRHLNNLGIKSAFDPLAEFDRMSAAKPLYINFVKHKTYLSVDEKGTEAAAVTAAGMATSVGPPESPFMMRVDHPFLLAIRENSTNAILFIGIITDISE